MKHKRQPFKIKSKIKWTLKKTHYTLKTFIYLVQHDINKIKIQKVKNPESNLSNVEQEAMKHLAEQKDIIITTADKGGTVVIMGTENYIKEANRQLSDKNNYKAHQTDPTLPHNKMAHNTFDRFKNENLLSKKTAEGLKVINPKTPKCYIPPKIHKKTNLGRSVIKSINCHTSEILRFVDHHFQPLVREIPPYSGKFIFSNHGCKSFISKHTKTENYSHKSDNKIFSTYFNNR